MNGTRPLTKCLACFFLSLCIFIQLFSMSYALDSSTLFNGCRGEEVRELQQALIDLGYLKGTADGIFGNKTENAVRQFQKKNKLTVDGLAGTSTRQLILSKAEAKRNQAAPAPAQETEASATPTPAPAPAGDSGTSSSRFGSYAAIRYGNRGDRVRSLQQALISLGYMGGKADGVFGTKTRNAVRSFQRSVKLNADGIAGKKTLMAIESALSGSSSPADTPAATETPAPVPDENELNPKISGPSADAVQLLHWFNVVKPSLSSGQHLLVYDPSSGYSWTLRILARGRHCDAEPLTEKDTRTMTAAFGGIKTWNQKAVFVQLPDGRWSLASTHDMPHDSGTVKNNGFNGHLCVHFLRDMDEARQNDPNYGVANQETIRAYWKRMTGEDVP